MIKGLLCHLRIIVFVVVYALGAYAPFDQHFADAQGVSPGSGGSPGQNVCPQCPASGTGDASCCCCLEQHIRNYDGGNVPNWFLDADPLDGAREPRDYEIKELTGSDLENAEIDPNESALTGVVDAWDMTPQEIFEAEYAKLKLGEQWLVDRVIEGNGQAPSRIPQEAIKGSTTLPVFKDLTTTRKLSSVDVFLYNPNPPEWFPDGPPPVMTAWYELKLGQKRCYYRCAKNRDLGAIASPGDWLCKENLQLFMCIPLAWEPALFPAERLQEILYLKSDPNAAIDVGLFVLDFAVGMTPFLGTADQVAQDWDKLKELDPAAVGMCLGGAAGDVVIVGKLSQLIKGANAASKFGKAVTVTSYAAGAGSVAAGATSLYLQNRDDWKEGSTWGRAAFFGIQAIGLITDRDAHRIIAPHIKRIALKAKMPQAWAACKNGCKGLKEKVKLFVRDESGTLNPQPLLNLVAKVRTNFNKWVGRAIPLWDQFQTHVPGIILKGRLNEGLKNSVWPWDHLAEGGHVYTDMKRWLDKFLNPGGQFAGMTDPRLGTMTIRDFLLDHFKVPNTVRSTITDLESLIAWCNQNKSLDCGSTTEGVFKLALPAMLMNSKGYTKTMTFAENVAGSCGPHRGYLAGGKTFINWSTEELADCARSILADQNSVILPPNTTDITGRGMLAGVCRGITFVVAIERADKSGGQQVNSIWPAWDSAFRP